MSLLNLVALQLNTLVCGFPKGQACILGHVFHSFLEDFANLELIGVDIAIGANPSVLSLTDANYKSQTSLFL